MIRVENGEIAARIVLRRAWVKHYDREGARLARM
jgi:hypothetical protein